MIVRLIRSLVITAFALQFCSTLTAQSLTGQGSSDQRPRLSIQLGHNNTDIRDAAYSPDGRFVATMGSDTSLFLWDAESGTQIREFVQPSTLFAFAFSPDGKFILTGGGRDEISKVGARYSSAHRDAYAILWDVATGERVQKYEIHRVTSVAFSPDGSSVLIGDLNANESTARLFETFTGKNIRRYKGKIRTLLVDVRFSPDGKSIFASAYDGSVHLLEVTSGLEVRSFKDGTGLNRIPMSIAPDGQLLLTGGLEPQPAGKPDNIARLWDVSSGAKLREFKHPSRVWSITHSPDGKYFISGSGPDPLETGEFNVHVWEIATGREVSRFKWRSLVKHLDFAPDGKQFVAVGIGDHVVSSWNTEDGKRRQPLEGYGASVVAVAFSPNGRFVLSGMGSYSGLEGIGIGGEQRNYAAHLWNIDSGRREYELKHRGPVGSVTFSADSRLALTGSGFGSDATGLWDVNTGERVKTFTQRSPISKTALSRDGRKVLIVARDRSLTGNAIVRLLDVDSERELLRFDYPVGSDVRCLALSPDSRYILVGSGGWTTEGGALPNLATVWDGITGKELLKVQAPQWVSSVAFSPDGQTFAVGSGDNIFRLWELSKGKELRSITSQKAGVTTPANTAVAFSPDGRFLLTGISPMQFDNNEPFARLWEVNTGKLIREFKHPSPVLSVAFSGDGKFVLTGSVDSTTRIWKTSTAEELCRMISFRDGTWVVVDAEGRFDTNNLEEMRGLRWIMPDEQLRPRPLEIFMRDYYQPRLLTRLLNGEELAPVRPLVNINRVQPVVNITSITPQPNQPELVTVTVEVSKAADKFQVGGREVTRETGVYDVRLFRDRQIVGESPAPIDSPVKAGRPAQSSELEAWRQSARVQLDRSGKQTIKFQNVQLPRRTGIEQVEFSAYAFNDDRVKSLTARKSFVLPQPIPPVKRRAYVITVGVSAYENKAWDLRFAAKDATLASQVLADSLAQAGEYAEIVPLSLTSDYRASDKQTIQTTATKANFKEVLSLLSGTLPAPRLLKNIPNAARLQKATPDDLVLIFFSSHGLYRKVAGRDSFYFLPYDIGAGERMVETPSLFARSISNEELANWLREVDAGEMILIANACQSEASVNTAGFKPGPLGNRSLGQLAYDKGMRILAGSQALSSAMEADELSASLLTRALITDGLQAHAADFQPRDQKITLSEWLKFGEQRVPKLYEEAKYAESRIQRPVLFDFVRTSRETKLANAPK